jgi:hypothetical protein
MDIKTIPVGKTSTFIGGQHGYKIEACKENRAGLKERPKSYQMVSDNEPKPRFSNVLQSDGNMGRI